jgi:hypothetical protein
MRKRLALVLGLLAIVVAVVAWRMRVATLGRVGAGYAAEQTCACLFVSGRALDSCRGDLDPLAQKLVTIHPGPDEVRASVAWVFRARAVYDKIYGCSLVE